MKRVTKARLLLVAGIVASIASQPPSFTVDTMLDIPERTLTSGVTTVKYVAYLDLFSSANLYTGGLYGSFNADFAIDLGGPMPPGYTVTLKTRSLDRDEAPTTTTAYFDNLEGKLRASAYASLWSQCQQMPCYETYELELTFPAQPADLARRITGSAYAYASASGDEPPRGTELLLSMDAIP